VRGVVYLEYDQVDLRTASHKRSISSRISLQSANDPCSRPSPVASLSNHHSSASRSSATHKQSAPVERIIGVSSLAESTVESVGDVGPSDLSLVVNLSNVDLDRGMVLGGDETVGGRALAGDVKVDDLALKRVSRVSVSVGLNGRRFPPPMPLVCPSRSAPSSSLPSESSSLPDRSAS
jgi:hypothetical protein